MSDKTSSVKRYRATVGPHGRVVIPAPLRRKLDLDEGSVLTFTEENGNLVITDRRAAVRRLQEVFRSEAPGGDDPVDELLQERRKEALRELEWMTD